MSVSASGSHLEALHVMEPGGVISTESIALR
jgi:hypothetical protein